MAEESEVISGIKKRPYTKVNNETRKKIIECVNRGLCYNDVSEMFDVKTNCISKIMRVYKMEGRDTKKSCRGHRQKKLDEEKMRVMCLWVEEDCTLQLKQIKQKCEDQWGIRVSSTTVSRALRDYHDMRKSHDFDNPNVNDDTINDDTINDDPNNDNGQINSNDTRETSQLLTDDEPYMNVNNNEVCDERSEICYAKELIIKLRIKCDVLRRECQCLREENRILKNELTNNGIKLESIRQLRDLTKARESRDSMKARESITSVNEKCDKTMKMNPLNDSGICKNVNFRGSLSNGTERRSQRLKKMRFDLNPHNDSDTDIDTDNDNSEITVPKSDEIVSKCINKQLPCDKPIHVENDDTNSEVLNSSLPNSGLKKRMAPKKYKCTHPRCNKTFALPYKLFSHERKHKKEVRIFKCAFEGCDAIYKSRDGLLIHRRRHTGEMPFDCTYPKCGYKTRNKNCMKLHLRQHTGERPFKCDWPGCECDFVGPTNLRAHLKKHLNDKPFACTFPGCESRFNERRTLLNHETIHTGDRKFKCSWPGCDHSFLTNKYLELHLRRHTNERPFPCDWPGCEWKSYTKGCLVTHKKVHTGERPFPCPRCERRFTHEPNLKDHIRVVHDKIRRFACDWENCGRRFTVRRLLNDHQLKEGHKKNTK